jgi:hypothetical protein
MRMAANAKGRCPKRDPRQLRSAHFGIDRHGPGDSAQARLAAGPRERPERWRRPTDLKADKVLQAIGFAPNVDGYGLEAAGVTLTDRKAIGIDDYLRTNVPHI